MAYALDLYVSHESGGEPIFADLWDSRPLLDFTGKSRQSKNTKFHQKLDISDDFVIYFYVCIVDEWSQISAL